jgi:hypothetical protein
MPKNSGLVEVRFHCPTLKDCLPSQHFIPPEQLIFSFSPEKRNDPTLRGTPKPATVTATRFYQ